MVTAIYPGSFDPPTNGHLDVIRRGASIFSKLIVAVAVNPRKNPLFTAQERVEFIRDSIPQLSNVEVFFFDGLIVNLCREKNAKVILRGIRTISDFEHEFQMAFTNRHFAPEVETIFVAPAEEYSYLSSSLLKEAIRVGGNMEHYIPKKVHLRLDEKLQKNEL